MARDLLTLLGEAGEWVGLNRKMKVNTVPWRTQSLFRQGCHYWGGLPMMKEVDLHALMRRFTELLTEREVHLELLGLGGPQQGLLATG